jgi:hypothetical protein
MTLKSYLWGMKIGALLSFIAWVLIIFNIDPTESAAPGKLLFYGSFFLFLSAFFIIILTWMRKKTEKGKDFETVYISGNFRQGILIAFLISILLVLQSFRILVWWDGALVVAGIFLVELYFLTRK